MNPESEPRATQSAEPTREEFDRLKETLDEMITTTKQNNTILHQMRFWEGSRSCLRLSRGVRY